MVSDVMCLLPNAPEAEGLREGLMALLQGQAEGWELGQYEIRGPDAEDAGSVQLSWAGADGIGRSISFQIGISHEVRTPHVTTGIAMAFFTDEAGTNIWHRGYYEHGGFATTALMAFTLVNHLFTVASTWTRADIEANQLPKFDVGDLVSYPFADL